MPQAFCSNNTIHSTQLHNKHADAEQRNVLKMKGKATVFNNCYLKWNSNFVGSVLCRHIQIHITYR